VATIHSASATPHAKRNDDAEMFKTSGYAMWFTAGGAIRIDHYDVITRKV